jgi:hypothetical protein
MVSYRLLIGIVIGIVFSFFTAFFFNMEEIIIQLQLYSQIDVLKAIIIYFKELNYLLQLEE